MLAKYLYLFRFAIFRASTYHLAGSDDAQLLDISSLPRNRCAEPLHLAAKPWGAPK